MQDSVFSTTFVQKHFFASPPPREVRAQLIAAGFTFDGHSWSRTISSVCPLSPSEAKHYIDQDAKDYRESGLTEGMTKLA